MSRLVVGKHTFSTTREYEAAVRDQEKIDTIKKEINFNNKEQVFSLYRKISDGEYLFETVIGREFDDEVYELQEALKQEKRNSKDAEETDKNSKKKKSTAISFEEFDEQMQEQILSELKKNERKRKFISFFCILIAIGAFGYLFVYSYMTKRTNSQTQHWSKLRENVQDSDLKVVIHKNGEEIIEKSILPEFAELLKLNKKLIGWIKIDDTIINYPVLQTSNNEYYLDHNFEQQTDKNGSIFMDMACDAMNRSTNLILYGHNMKSGKMFGILKNYVKESYYKEHKYIQFDTIYDKGTYEILAVFRSKVYTEEEIVFKYYQFIDAASQEEFDSNINEMKKMSFYDTGVTAEYGDELLTLSTCDSNESDGRFVVVAKKIK